MSDESMASSGATWARIRARVVPADSRREPKEIEISIEICPTPDFGPWSVELHTESAAPASGEGKGPCGGRPRTAPKAAFYAEAVFVSGAVLTHIKSRCETFGGERFTKAVKLPEALEFVAGDLARIEIDVYSGSSGPIAPPSVGVFQEPEPGHAAAPSSPELGARRFGLSGRLPTRPLGLYY